MLLVWYKREFDWSDVLRLWEGLWTDYLSSQFHLFIAVAILEKHRDVIMEHLKHFDEVLKYINELSGTIELRETMIRAEGLFKRFERTVGVVEKKDNLPDLRRRQKAAIVSGPGRPPQGASAGSKSTGSDARPTSKDGKEGEELKTNIITPELRNLMKRDIFWADDGGSKDEPSTRQSGLKD